MTNKFVNFLVFISVFLQMNQSLASDVKLICERQSVFFVTIQELNSEFFKDNIVLKGWHGMKSERGIFKNPFNQFLDDATISVAIEVGPPEDKVFTVIAEDNFNSLLIDSKDTYHGYGSATSDTIHKWELKAELEDNINLYVHHRSLQMLTMRKDKTFYYFRIQNYRDGKHSRLGNSPYAYVDRYRCFKAG